MYVRLCNNFEAKPFRLHNEIELIENHAGVNDSQNHAPVCQLVLICSYFTVFVCLCFPPSMPVFAFICQELPTKHGIVWKRGEYNTGMSTIGNCSSLFVPPSYTYTDSEAWTSELFRAGRQVSGSAILP